MKVWERNRTLNEVLLARRSATVILLEVLCKGSQMAPLPTKKK